MVQVKKFRGMRGYFRLTQVGHWDRGGRSSRDRRSKEDMLSWCVGEKE